MDFYKDKKAKEREYLETRRKIYEEMKRVAEEAQKKGIELHQKMIEDDIITKDCDYNINDYGEIERPYRSR